MSSLVGGVATFVSIVALASAVSLGRRLYLRERTTRRLIGPGIEVNVPRLNPSKRVLVMVGVAGSILVALTQGLVLGLIAFAVILGTVQGISSIRRQRQINEYERNLPLCLDSMARSLRSGAGILPALSEAGNATHGPVGRDVAMVAREAKMGRSLSEALDAWKLRQSLPSVQLSVGALTLALETGAAQAQVVDSIASNLRQHLNAQAMAKSAAVEYQMSSVVLSVIPVVICVPTVLFNDEARQFMLHTTIGSAFFIAGLALDAAGFLWMSQMIKRSMR